MDLYAFPRELCLLVFADLCLWLKAWQICSKIPLGMPFSVHIFTRQFYYSTTQASSCAVTRPVDHFIYEIIWQFDTLFQVILFRALFLSGCSFVVELPLKWHTTPQQQLDRKTSVATVPLQKIQREMQKLWKNSELCFQCVQNAESWRKMTFADFQEKTNSSVSCIYPILYSGALTKKQTMFHFVWKKFIWLALNTCS